MNESIEWISNKTEWINHSLTFPKNSYIHTTIWRVSLSLTKEHKILITITDLQGPWWLGKMIHHPNQERHYGLCPLHSLTSPETPSKPLYRRRTNTLSRSWFLFPSFSILCCQLKKKNKLFQQVVFSSLIFSFWLSTIWFGKQRSMRIKRVG